MSDEKPLTAPPLPPRVVLNQAVNIVYSNHTHVNISQSDIQIIFSINGKPLVATALTLPVAKNLQKILNEAMSNYEQKTNTVIADLTVLTELLKK